MPKSTKIPFTPPGCFECVGGLGRLLFEKSGGSATIKKFGGEQYELCQIDCDKCEWFSRGRGKTAQDAIEMAIKAF